eukprot:1231501-Rhodomonas_salina.1
MPSAVSRLRSFKLSLLVIGGGGTAVLAFWEGVLWERGTLGFGKGYCHRDLDQGLNSHHDDNADSEACAS